MVRVRHSVVVVGQNNPDRQVSQDAWNSDHTLIGTANKVVAFDGSGQATELDQVTIATSNVAATRTALAAISTGANVALLRESGREGMFVFDSSNLSANVTADPQQGIYVPPASDTTGASGAWVRKYVGPVYLEWFGGGTSVADNKTAWDAIVTLLPDCYVFLNPGTYSISLMAFPTASTAGVKVVGAGRSATTILVTGDGGGAPSAGANGGVRMFGYTSMLQDLLLQYNNASLQCLLNISGVSQAGRNIVQRVDMSPSGLSASQVAATAIYMENLNACVIAECQIGIAPNFKQNIVIRGFWSSCSIRDCTIRPHARDAANNVWCSENFQIDIKASTQSAQIYNNTFEQGPNGIKAVGQGSLSLRDNYMADGAAAVGFWLPSTAYAQSSKVYPSASITATSDGTTAVLTSVSSTAALYAGQKVVGIGMGAAGANLSARIQSVDSSSQITLDTATATAAVGAGVYYGAYAQHAYICSVAGTSGTSAPTWPTTLGTTVADNTVTWREHNSCAWVDANDSAAFGSIKDSLIVAGGIMFSNVMGVLARRATGGAQPGAVRVEGISFNTMNICGKLDGCQSAVVQNCKIKGYTDCGFQLAGEVSAMRDLFAFGNNNNAGLTVADFVANTNSTSLSGVHMGTTSLTGIGAKKIFNLSTSPTSSPGLNLLGSLLSNSSTGGVGYATGAGGTVSQATSKSTGVTLNKPCGQVTMNGAALASGAKVSFVVTNSQVAATDIVTANVVSGGTANAYRASVTAVAAGSYTVTVENITAGSLSEQPVIGFAVFKTVTA